MSAPRQPRSFVRAASFLALIVACRDVTTPDTPVPLGSSAVAAKKGPKPPATDGQAPTIPVFSVLDVGPTHITLTYSSTDVSQPILYSVQRNGDVSTWTFDSVRTYKALQPQTTYTFVAKARDAAGNWSQLSAPFSVTTTAPDPNDVTPPTAPTNVWADLYDGSTEIQVFWTASTDDVTPQSVIIYHMYVNGALENSSAGVPQTTGYGVAGENVITVIAVDGAGNRSSAGSFTLFIPF
jgi:chitodextrinase